MAILRTYAEVLELEPNEAERDLIENCQAGELCRLGYDVPTEPSDSRTIRADILRYLLLGGCETCKVDGRGVWLIGGYISGTLDLDFATIHGATQLRNCHFENRLDSVQTRFKQVDLSDSTLNGWRAQGAKIEGPVFLRHITASATIDLNSATIGAQLSCNGAKLTAKAGNALDAQGAKIEDSVFLINVTASATINFNGATIGGQLVCEGAKLTAKTGHALIAQRAKIEGSVFLRDTTTSATIDLNGATIGGQLSCTGARITTQDPYALVATNAQITGGVFLHPRIQPDKDKPPFHATGELRFNGSTLGGFYAEDITLEATTTNTTLSLGGATVNGSVRLSGSTSTGEMMLAGSKISGRLICEKLRFQNTKGHAFNGKAMRVDRAFIWKKLSEEGTGAVSLNGRMSKNWMTIRKTGRRGMTSTLTVSPTRVSPPRLPRCLRGWTG